MPYGEDRPEHMGYQPPLTCADAIAAITTALREDRGTIDARVAEHIAGCASCRAAMLLMVRALGGGPAQRPAPDVQLCSRCQEDLAAFIDLEQISAVRAATVYPHVWWHLWICPRCARTYDLTRELLQAESAGRIPSLHAMILNTRAPAPRWRFPIARKLMGMMLPKSPLRSAQGAKHLLYQSRPGESSMVRVDVEAQGPDQWKMTIRVTPQQDGLAVVTCGPFRSVALFDAEGVALVDALPARVLTDTQAPDLDISIFPVEPPHAAEP